MDETTAKMILSPAMQLGFAGFSFVLLCILIWLIRELLKILKDTNHVISTNTDAIHTITAKTEDVFEIQVQLKDKLNSRPCIANLRLHQDPQGV